MRIYFSREIRTLGAEDRSEGGRGRVEVTFLFTEIGRETISRDGLVSLYSVSRSNHSTSSLCNQTTNLTGDNYINYSYS